MGLEEIDVMPLVERYRQRLRETSLRFKRYLYSRINWNARFIGIRGARGVGKTTMLLQKIIETHENIEEALYISLDDMWFSTHTLEDLVGFLYSRGITDLYIDEVHKYPEWTRVLKNLYDFYPSLKIVYTGSALLAIDNSEIDLSRRQTLYTLEPMSFREFLEYEGIATIPPVTLPELLKDHVKIAMRISKDIKVLKYFDDFLRFGSYPYYKENREDYLIHLQATIRLVIETDIPECEAISISTVTKLKTLLMLIAENTPFEPNIAKLSEKLDSSRELCLKMLYLLDRAKLIRLLYFKPSNYKQLKGPEKIVGGDTNILYSLTNKVDTGTWREIFFTAQLSNVGSVSLARKGDFIIDGKYLFEVGGPNKKFDQIADLPDSYLAIDNIETGFGSRIPLWMFGLLY